MSEHPPASSTDAPTARFSTPPAAFIAALIATVVFVMGACIWKLGVDVIASAALFSIAIAHGSMPSTMELNDLARGDVLGVAFYLALGGILVLGGIVQLVLKRQASEVFALSRASIVILIAGFIGAIFVGWFPSWTVEQMLQLWPVLNEFSSLDIITNLLLEGPLFGRIVMLSSVCIGAPILEELIFRGVLWDLFELCVVKAAGFNLFQTGGQLQPSETHPKLLAAKRRAPWIALIATSLLFAAFHMNPVQSVALIPTAFFIGWLRLTSKSIWPCVLAHFVNNALATVMIFISEDYLADFEWTLPIALIGLTVTLLFAALCWPWRKRAAI